YAIVGTPDAGAVVSNVDRRADRTWRLSSARGNRNRRFYGDLSRNSEQLKGFVTRPFGLSAAVSGTSARTLLLLTQRPRISDRPSMEDDMLYWALVFFIIAIIAAFFGFGGVATTAASIAQILFFVFL